MAAAGAQGSRRTLPGARAASAGGAVPDRDGRETVARTPGEPCQPQSSVVVAAGLRAVAGALERRLVIVRDVAATSRREFDLVIIGGGIHGVALLHEAARRGVAACLCEARDFGGATSWNSLRILHGGLRYLQTLDLVRFFDSVAARRRLALMFPRLVRPLTCLMPLYGNSLRR